MATDSSVSDLAGRYRRLAALVEQLESDGYNVVDAEPTEDQHGRQHAEVQLNLDGGLGIEPFHVGETEDVDDADEENRGQASISSPCNGGGADEEDEDKSEHQPADDLQEALEKAGVETDEEPDPDSAAGAVLATLREEGELPGKKLKLVSGVSNIYSVVSELHDDGLVAKRRDPDDGRRTLYRPAEMDVDDEPDDQDDAPEWNGEDPEVIVADSSLPARVVLEDILNAVASASTVIEAAETLDVDVDNLEPVCWHLTLKQPDSLEIVDNIEDRIKTVQEVADVE